MINLYCEAWKARGGPEQSTDASKRDKRWLDSIRLYWQVANTQRRRPVHETAVTCMFLKYC